MSTSTSKSSKVQLGINYIAADSMIHQLNGITKFVLFLGWTTAVLVTFDLRILLAMLATGLLLLNLSKVPFQAYKVLLISAVSVLSLNALFMFLLAPQQGPELIGTSTPLLTLPFHYTLTAETLFYLVNVTIKYFCMFPVALLFVFTTHPTEFSASLNRLGVPYKIAYAVSLTLRYLPDIKKDFMNIMHAQQARGLDFSKNVSFTQRMKNGAKILGPLLFSSLDRADEISNAMTLRGFGRNNKRSWYSERKLQQKDTYAIGMIIMAVSAAIYYRWSLESLFWYPF
ncbi:energy-coupling factor transporter transmembrane protein EcfT [Vibrio sp.]|nr:energy-coupling factor transporter transmembrane protein EcfT [Vibrio sp.]